MINKISIVVAIVALVELAAFENRFASYDVQARALLTHANLVIGTEDYELFYPLALHYLDLPPQTKFDDFANLVASRREVKSSAQAEACAVLEASSFTPYNCLQIRLKVIERALAAGYMDPKYGSCINCSFEFLKGFYP